MNKPIKILVVGESPKKLAFEVFKEMLSKAPERTFTIIKDKINEDILRMGLQDKPNKKEIKQFKKYLRKINS
jgi:hypothetical protein